MTKQNRGTLKRYFDEGSLPSGEQFAELIDSMLNIVEDGFDKTPRDGFKISLIGDHSRLISFYRSGDPHNPVWCVEYDQEKDQLKIVNPRLPADRQAAMTFDADGNVSVGVIAAHGRLGANPDGNTTVPADGKWHDITGELHGCHAIEVVAGAGSPGTGRYALLRAVALNTYNPRGWWFNLFNLKKRIRCQQAYYLSRGNRIKLRWQQAGEDKYTLQMRTACGFGEGVDIRFYLTNLWVDPGMDGSRQSAAGKQ